MTHLAINLLGHFEVTLDGQPAPRFRTDKMRALLAYLAVEAERDHRRAMLAGLLWPDFPEADARHNLSQALWRLRQLLGEGTPPFFLTTRQTLRFNPKSDATVDVADFQAGVAICERCSPEKLSDADARALTQTVALYRGEFLITPLQIDSQAFEEWVLLTRTQFHLQALDALDTLGQYHAARSEFDQVAAYARRQIELDPLREAAHRQLMDALTRDGHRTEALTQYATCQTLLAEELGVAPAPETIALYENIQAPQSELLPSLPQRHKKPGTGPLISPPPFVGRARELARLDMEGQGQVRFVTGEAGSGKTALLEAFAQRALATHANLLVVNGSGNAYTGSGDPYWPFIEMLEQLCGAPKGEGADSISTLLHQQAQRLAKTQPIVKHVISAHGPDLHNVLGCDGTETPGIYDLQQARLFAQMTRVLHAVAARYPLVLMLDDAQWADQASVNLLFHLGRELAGQRMLIVGAFRSDVFHADAAATRYHPQPDAGPRSPTPPKHPLATLFNELQRRWGDVQLDLAQTSGRAFIDALVDSEPNHLGTAFRETLYRHTNGQALFTTELLRGMQTRGDLVRDASGYWVEGAEIAWDALPARVEGVIAEQIDQLLPDWQRMLSVASIEGDEFTAQVMACVIGLPATEVSRRLSGALARYHHLIVPVGVYHTNAQALARYRFRHLLFQRYLYDRMDAVERAQLHLHVGQILETLYRERAREIALSLARHFELGGHIEKAVVYLLQAGQRANRLAATEEAVHLLTHGLTLCQHFPPSPARQQQEADLHLALGNALLAKGWDSDERAEISARAYALGQRAGDLGQVARSLVMMANVAMGRGQLPQLIAIGEQLQALAQHPNIAASESLTAQLALYGDYVWGSRYFCQGDLHTARQYLTRVIQMQASPSDTLVETNLHVISQVWLVYTLGLLGYLDQALACSQQAIAIVRDLGYALSLQFALSIGQVGAHYLRREPRAMRATLAQLTALDADASLAVFQPWVILFEGWLMAVVQHDAAGLGLMQKAIQAWEDADSRGGVLLQYNLLIEGYLALDQADAALAPLETILDFIDASGFRSAEAEFLRLKGEAWRMLERADEAEACFQHALALARAQDTKTWELRAAMSLCRLYQATGQAAQLMKSRAQLAEVYAWFTEGLDTADLREAAALLAEVAQNLCL